MGQGIALDGAGNVYVSDAVFNHRVQKFNSAGVYQSQFAGNGSGNGQFFSPRGIDIGAGNVYVADANDRVQKFDSAGAYQSQFGTSGSGNGESLRASGQSPHDGETLRAPARIE